MIHAFFVGLGLGLLAGVLVTGAFYEAAKAYLVRLFTKAIGKIQGK